MNKEISLDAFLESYKKKDLADLLGWTPSALSQAIRAGRDIRLIKMKKHHYSVHEVKPLGEGRIDPS